VKAVADPQERGRQYLATFLSGLAGTHAAGFVLSRQGPAGKSTVATFALAMAAAPGAYGIGLIGWKGEQFRIQGSDQPVGPMPDTSMRFSRPHRASGLTPRETCSTPRDAANFNSSPFAVGGESHDE
jgi:hypothetical protein